MEPAEDGRCADLWFVGWRGPQLIVITGMRLKATLKLVFAVGSGKILLYVQV
jgi:hypothetical protein